MNFQQIRDFVNPAVAQATGLQEVGNLSMPVPVAFVANGNGGGSSSNLALFEMKLIRGSDQYDVWYQSIDSATDIANAFLAGKTVLLHFTLIEETEMTGNYIRVPIYVQMLAYTPAYTSQTGDTYPASIILLNSSGALYDDHVDLPLQHFTGTVITEDDKLRVNIYVD